MNHCEFHIPNAQMVGISLLMFILVPITVHAQYGTSDEIVNLLPPPITPFVVEEKQLRELAPELTLNERFFFFVQDVRETFTFDPVEKAEVKLRHAEENQIMIDNLDSLGQAIPIEFEQRRIEKINEATVIISESNEVVLPELKQAFETLHRMGEINSIRVLYSQLPEVIKSDEETKTMFENKVTSLKAWRENCFGNFDVDELGDGTFDASIDRIEEMCPLLIELQQQFGRERVRLLVTGEV